MMQGHVGEEEEIEGDYLEMMVAGDNDAVTVTSFEKHLEEMFQEVPDLQTALVSYVEARSKPVEKKRHRGFWPVKGQSKGKSFGKRKGGPMSGKSSLLSRIARTLQTMRRKRALEGQLNSHQILELENKRMLPNRLRLLFSHV